jgi:vanillate O-demethylase monooxygenase subunit
MSYLRNAWYVGAWRDELKSGLFARKMLGETICMFRGDTGRVSAIHDRCPHRFAPLHKGKLINGTVQCPYHGLRFGPDGRCVHNPHGDGVVPRKAISRSYPVIERHDMIWVWMGDPEKANPASIPDFSFMDNPEFTIVKGHLNGDGNYELFTDNILDIGHAEFLHVGLGAPAFTRAKRKVWQDGDTIWSNLEYPNDAASPATDFILQLGGRKVDVFAPMRWNAPASMLFDFKVGIPGDGVKPQGLHPSLHIFTPETETSTHYFWAAAKHRSIGDAEHTEKMRAAIAYAFEGEDKPMIGDVQENMQTSDIWALNPILLAGDTTAVRARRLLAKLIAAEQAAPASPTREPEVATPTAETVTA